MIYDEMNDEVWLYDAVVSASLAANLVVCLCLASDHTTLVCLD